MGDILGKTVSIFFAGRTCLHRDLLIAYIALGLKIQSCFRDDDQFILRIEPGEIDHLGPIIAVGES